MERFFVRIADFIRETDKFLLILCLMASGYGCLAVFSSTRYMGSYRSFLVHTLSMLVGIFAAFILSTFDFTFFTKRWYLAAVAGVIPVVLTFFIGYAPAGTDDKAWLDLGFTTFQPAELLKICFIVTFAAHLSAVKSSVNKLKTLIPVCLHGALPVLLIHFQGDDGTALVFAIMVICMLMAAGVSWKYFLVALSAALIASPLVYFFVMNQDQRARIISMFDIDADIRGIGFQQYRGRMALANGGITGQGYLKGSLTQVGGVPEGYNDFIFVSIGEELGFIGCMIVVLLLAAICIRTLRIAYLCRKDSGTLICIGFFGMLFAQIIINLGK